MYTRPPKTSFNHHSNLTLISFKTIYLKEWALVATTILVWILIKQGIISWNIQIFHNLEKHCDYCLNLLHNLRVPKSLFTQIFQKKFGINTLVFTHEYM